MSAKARVGVIIVAVATLLFVPASFAQEPSLSQVYQAAESGNFTQAQQMMDQVLRNHPNSAKAHFVQAELLARQGRMGAAQAELNTAERLEPGLPFARPQAVQELKRRTAGSGGLNSPSGQIVPAAGSNISVWTVLLGAGLVLLIFLAVRAMRRRTATYIPAGGGAAYGQPSGFGAPGTVQPYSGAAGPMASAGGGMGRGILGGLATGAALGAGMVAGEALAHRLGGGHGAADASSLPLHDAAHQVPDDMGGPDFGISDSSSWDDNMSSGGSDWSYLWFGCLAPYREAFARNAAASGLSVEAKGTARFHSPFSSS